MRLPDSASIFTAEIWAIIKAVDEIKYSVASKYIVFTDSFSCLQALQSMKLEHPLIEMVIRKCVFLNFAKKDIILCWVPSRIGIRGNERTDSTALSALDLPHAKVGVGLPYNDFKHGINQFFPLGKMIGMVRLRTSFILSSQSCGMFLKQIEFYYKF